MSSAVAPGPEAILEQDGKESVQHEADLNPQRHDSKISEQEKEAASSAAENNNEDKSERGQSISLDTSLAAPALPYRNARQTSPSSALSIKTDIPSPSQITIARLQETPTIYENNIPNEVNSQHLSASALPLHSVGSTLQSTLSTSSMASSISPGLSASTFNSPFLATMSDLTPLPSPLVIGDRSLSESWRKLHPDPSSPSRSRAGSLDEPLPAPKYATLSTSPSPPKKRKGYGSLLQDAMEANASAMDDNAKVSKGGHTRNRSISDFVPEQLHNVKHRHVTFGPGDTATLEAQEYRMQRERHLAAQRGLTIPFDAKQQQQFPTPPPSTSSVAEDDEADNEPSYLEDGTAADYLEIHCGLKNKRRKFRQLRQLGEGTFSKVMLATREKIPAHPTPEIEEHLDPHRLVAVKIVQHGPAGGADAERIETSLKREVEMLKSVSHPSLVHLKACEYQDKRALLVLTYCPGGDLFELASQKREALTPPMVQRMFAELVSAVRYLHVNWIVHRDIKLENVLVNLPNDQLKMIEHPLTHPTPIVTLTDLGLSRRIPEPPESPLLQTRCGSEDYAAPEILLGQPYDGRQTDAWALGVLLYALMEGRLPFDAPPGKPERSRNTHRIARCDWIWCRFGDEDGDWDSSLGTEYEGAQGCVEGLIKKVRMGRKPLEDIEKTDWVQNGIQVPGGLKMRGLDEDDAVFL